MKDLIAYKKTSIGRIIDIIPTVKNIKEVLINLTRKQNDIYKFFSYNEDCELCFVNFKNPEPYYGNDLMLAKVFKLKNNIVYVEWINGMTSRIEESELNIVSTAALSGDTRRITPNPEKGSVKIIIKDKDKGKVIQEKVIEKNVEEITFFIEDILQANGETPEMDNPVPSLKEQYNEAFYDHPIIKDIEDNFTNELLKKIISSKNGRETDKEAVNNV